MVKAATVATRTDIKAYMQSLGERARVAAVRLVPDPAAAIAHVARHGSQYVVPDGGHTRS